MQDPGRVGSDEESQVGSQKSGEAIEELKVIRWKY